VQQKYYKQEHIADADYFNNNETVGHIISLCPILVTEHHLKRYDIKPVVNYKSPVEMLWRTVTHRMGSEGETGK
jgi:hypothetical protein